VRKLLNDNISVTKRRRAKLSPPGTLLGPYNSLEMPNIAKNLFQGKIRILGLCFWQATENCFCRTQT